MEYKYYSNIKYVSFRGEYSNGERNGKGKEYISNEGLIFEGEYKDNKRWNGIGKEFELFGLCTSLLSFEGEYKNGEKWNGKIYKYGLDDGLGYYIKLKCKINNGIMHWKEYELLDKNNLNSLELSFEGEFKNDKRWKGKGKEYYKVDIHLKKLCFEGEYFDGKKKGRGKEYLEDEIIFEGEYNDDKRWNGKTSVIKYVEYEIGKIYEIKYEYKNGTKTLIKRQI